MSKSSNHSKASAAPSTVDMVGLDVEEKGKSLREFFSYPFSSDETFQRGLIGILAQRPVQEDTSELVVKMQLFYFNRRTGYNLELADVRAHDAGSTSALNQVLHQADLPPSSAAATVPSERRSESADIGQQEGNIESPHILTFTELKSLIESGNTENIPHNRHILDHLNECNPSQSNAMVRKKPWEAAS